MNSQNIRDIANELQQQLDASRTLARAAPSGIWPVLLSDDRVDAFVTQLRAFADEEDQQQTAFRRIYQWAAKNNAVQVASLALQFANLSTAPPA